MMTRRFSVDMEEERYLGNKAKKEVHDLDHEDLAANGGQIDEIIAVGPDTPFNNLPSAHFQEFDNCAKCLQGSRR